MSFLKSLQDFLDDDTNDYENVIEVKQDLRNPPLSDDSNSIQTNPRVPLTVADLNQFRYREQLNKPITISSSSSRSSSDLSIEEVKNYSGSNHNIKTSNEVPFSRPLGINKLNQSLIPLDENTKKYGETIINTRKDPFEILDSIEFDTSNQIISCRNMDSSISSKRLSINVLPINQKQIFTFQEFNEMQSECFQSIYNSQDNCVISSPTGSGKTVLFELAILKEITKQNLEFKVLYLAPTKALCNERLNDWTSKFSSLSITCGMLTGDTSFKEAENVRKSNIIISTPEKWDMITRRWRDYKKLFELIQLLLIDEIHILKENRGSTLEVVITRMKRICIGLRILAISATVANAQDISTWLKLNDKSILPAQTLCFGDEYRAVKLIKFVYGYKLNKEFNDFQFDQLLNTKLMEIINLHSNNKPVLIFCSTRNNCQKTAKFIDTKLFNGEIELKLKDRELYNLAKKGVAYHHAGLAYADRKQIESAFLNGKIKYLCCTSTLAIGINLPAYLVIVKGTRCWNENSFKEYAETDILQMLGRAGRPQFEDEGCAVIMTSDKLKLKYERLIKGSEKIESSLHLNFYDHLVAEMAVGTFSDLQGAINWLKTTYFYVRFLLNPSYYSIVSSDNDLTEFCMSKIKELSQEQLISSFKCTSYGLSMTMHYIKFETMKMLIHLTQKNLILTDLLDIVSKSSEFNDMKLKHQEKKLYKEINNMVKYPMKELNKINLIIQFELGGLDFPNYTGALKLHSSFLGDKFYIFKHTPRILMAMLDVFVEKKSAGSLINSSFLLRCINGKCWEDTPNELRQLEGVGTVNAKKFTKHNVNCLNDGKSLTSSQIEYFLNLKTGGGMKIYKVLTSLPEISVVAKLEDQELIENKIKLRFKFDLMINTQMSTFKGKPIYIQLISSIGDSLIDFRRIPIKKIGTGKDFTIECTLTKIESKLHVNASTEQIAGIKVHESFKINLNNYIKENFIPQDDSIDWSDEGDQFKQVCDSQLNNVENEIEQIEPRIEKLTCNHKCKNKLKCAHSCCKAEPTQMKGDKPFDLEKQQGEQNEETKLIISNSKARWKRGLDHLINSSDDEAVNAENVLNLSPANKIKKSMVFKIDTQDKGFKKPKYDFFVSSSDEEDFIVEKFFIAPNKKKSSEENNVDEQLLCPQDKIKVSEADVQSFSSKLDNESDQDYCKKISLQNSSKFEDESNKISTNCFDSQNVLQSELEKDQLASQGNEFEQEIYNDCLTKDSTDIENEVAKLSSREIQLVLDFINQEI